MAESEAATGTIPAKTFRQRVFYGWWIVTAGVGVQFLQSALLGQAYGAYVVLLRNDFGWSKTLLSGASALREAESGITGPIQGWLLDRFGPRAVARSGVVTLGIGFMLFSRITQGVSCLRHTSSECFVEIGNGFFYLILSGKKNAIHIISLRISWFYFE